MQSVLILAQDWVTVCFNLIQPKLKLIVSNSNKVLNASVSTDTMVTVNNVAIIMNAKLTMEVAVLMLSVSTNVSAMSVSVTKDGC